MPRAAVRPLPERRAPARVAAIAALLGLLLAVAGSILPAAAPSVPFPAPFSPGVARAADALDLQTTARYVVDPAHQRVRVTVDITAANEHPDATTGGSLTRYFFDGLNLGVQPDAARLHAVQDGTAIGVKAATRAGYRLVTLRFRSKLYYQQSTTVRLSYDLPAGAPRSSSDVRVGSAFATFVAWAFGDRGSVRVEVPSDFRVDIAGAAMATTPGPDGYQAYTATTSTPLGWYASVNATNDANLTHETLSLSDGEQVVIRAWPEDTRWHTRVRGLLTDGVPDLVARIGLPWPVKGPLTVTEVHTPLLEGYAGFYDPSADTITISEDLDDLTIVHEASHAWFNTSLFTERWIDEGLADEYASRVLVALGRKRPDPGTANRQGKAAFRLESWGPPAPIRDAAADAHERFGYDASWTVMRAIVRHVGLDGMRKVFASAAAGTTAYPGEGAPEPTRLPRDWRRFLDLAETYATQAGVGDLFEAWVLEPAQRRLLADRTTARRAYDDLEALGGTWAPPDTVRTSMDAWRFGAAQDAMRAATTVLEERDQVAALATGQGLALPPATETRYQDAGSQADLATLGDQLRSSETALEHLAAASNALAVPRDWFTEVGLDRQDPAVTVDAARAAWTNGDYAATTAGADEAVAMLAAAPEAGRSRVTTIAAAVGAAVLVLLVAAAVLLLRRRRNSAPALAAMPPAIPAWTEPYATLPPDGPPSGPTPAPSPRDEGAPRS